MSKYTRRALLGIGGVLGVGAVAYGAGLIGCRFVHRNVPDFFAQFEGVDGVDTEILRKVGLAVLRERPEYAVPEYVTASLAAKPYSAAAMETTCPKERLAHLQMQCRADFDQDDYLIVDGWMISQTEAAFCASLA